MEAFDWGRIALNGNPPSFLFEVLFRSLAIFIVTFAFLRLIGRRGVKQMTPLEVVILLVLGSAASDVALQEDFPFLPVLVTFVVITTAYKLLTFSVRKNEKLQYLVEGKSVPIVRDGRLLYKGLDRLGITENEVFMELRQKSIEHLGQVRLALMELDGNVSVYFQPDEAVRPGLSILPTGVTLSHPEEDEDVECAALVACCQCGHTMTGRMDAIQACPECRGRRWGRACASRRIG